MPKMGAILATGTPFFGAAPKRQLKKPGPTMTVAELAARLGVHPQTVYAAIARKEIPGARRVGRLIKLNRATVEAWLTGRAR